MVVWCVLVHHIKAAKKFSLFKKPLQKNFKVGIFAMQYISFLTIFLLSTVSFFAKADEVNFHKLKSSDFVELGSFIKLFMPNSSDGDDSPDWFVGTDNEGLPILWKTIGVDSSSVTEIKKFYFRDALALIKVNGSIMKTLKTQAELLTWDIKVIGDWDRSPSYANFNPNLDCFGSLGSGCEYDLLKALAVSDIDFKLVCEYRFRINTTVEYAKIYRVSSKNKKDAYIQEAHTEGSGGGSTMVTLIYSPYLKAFVKAEIIDHIKHSCSMSNVMHSNLESCLKQHTVKTNEVCQ